MAANRSESRRDKLVDDKLRVHAWTPKGFRFAGVLDLEEDGEQLAASFQYQEAYLADAHAYPLDPINLPLGRTLHATQSQFVRLGAIFDAAPDAWGRKVVTAQLPQEARQRVFRSAFLRGADGIGSHVLTPDAAGDDLDLDAIVQMSLNERPALSELDRAQRAARDFEAGLDLTDEMRSMLGGSWTIGGARPKAILQDDRAGAPAGLSVIAKFDSINDQVPRNRIEEDCLSMAQDMGLNVKGHWLRELDGGRTALVLERFDRPVVDGAVHRLNYLSAMSLASYEPQSKFLNSAMDQAVISWSKLLEISSRVCERPSSARLEMFARLAFNAAVQNSDDHLKNFALLKAPGSLLHYTIAPVFDVSAQAGQRHYLHCLDLGQVYSLQDVMPMARRLGIAKGVAEEVEQRLLEVLAERHQYLDGAGLSRADAQKVNEWIEQGLGSRYVERVREVDAPEQVSAPSPG